MPEELMIFLESIFNDIFKNLNDSTSLITNVVLTIIVLFAWYWLFKLSRKLIYKFVQNVKTYTILIKIIQNFLMIISILILLGIWANMKNAVLLLLTLFVILTGLSLKNLFANIVGWFMLLRKKYFKLYDRIEIMEHTGDVIKITPIYFKIVERGNKLSSSTATGRIINIPNHVLLENTLLNYNKFSKVNFSEVKYYITVDSDWQAALAILEAELAIYLKGFLTDLSDVEIKIINAQLELMDESLTTKTYVKIDDESILLIGQYPIMYTKGTSTESLLNKQILPQLAQLENVELSGKAVHVDIDKFVKGTFLRDNEV